jgi:hypothetical protein
MSVDVYSTRRMIICAAQLFARSSHYSIHKYLNDTTQEMYRNGEERLALWRPSQKIRKKRGVHLDFV